jgi:hypothetical protein
MAEAGGELIGKVRRDGCGQIIGVAQSGVAALDDETGNDAVPREARIKGFPFFASRVPLARLTKLAHISGARAKKSSVVKVPRGVVNSV